MNKIASNNVDVGYDDGHPRFIDLSYGCMMMGFMNLLKKM